MSMPVAAATHVGRVRERNEDHAIVGDRLLSGPQDSWAEATTAPPVLLGVLDGMGGHPAGDVASWIAATVLSKSAPPTSEEDVGRIVAAMQQAVHEHMAVEPDTTAMGTTLVFASVLEAGRALVAAVGDSMALWQSDDDELQALVATDRNRGGLITQCIGGTRAPGAVQPHVVEVRGPGRLLLCTDGLTDVLDPDEIASAMRDDSPQDVVADLVDRAIRGGGPDNVTVAVVDLGANGR